MLDPAELKDLKCVLCNSTPIIKKEKHLFIDLPKLQKELEEWTLKQEVKGTWPNNAKAITGAWLKEGLKPRCITRNLKWGVQVNKKGFENKVFYSWFDAPIAYISITKELTNKWQDWWKNPKDVLLYQFMAKDNIPFHTILFPAFLIGSRDNYTLLHHIASTEYLNYEDSKFSKSKGTGVFGDDVISTGIPSDLWRYYLIAIRPETSDSKFTWKDFQTRVNSELLANLGNFINRILTFIDKNYDKVLPKFSLDKNLEKNANEIIKKIEDNLENVQLREALKEFMSLSSLGNQYFQSNEPWKLINENRKQADEIVGNCVNLIYLIGVYSEPFLPNTSKEIFKQLNIEKPKEFGKFKLFLKQNHRLGGINPLFARLEDEDITKYENKFNGNQTKELDFSKLNLKVAKIEKVEKHPDADKLYILQLDLGNEKRQIVSGLVPYYKKEELKNKNIIVVTNLKPSKLRGIDSAGMLLAADDKGKVVVLEASKSRPGDQVYIDKLKPSNKIITYEEFIKIELIVKNKKVWNKNNNLKTDKEELNINVSDGSKLK